MTNPSHKTQKPPSYQTIYLPHKPTCGFTKLTDGKVTLHRLGLLPLRCDKCGDMMQPQEGIALPEDIWPREGA